MNYELSDKLKSAIEEEIARLASLSDMSKEVALGDDFCFTPTQGKYAGHRVNIFSLSKDGSRILVGNKTYIYENYLYENYLWRVENSWPTETSGGLAFECREARRAGKIVEILEIGEDTENEEGEEK